MNSTKPAGFLLSAIFGLSWVGSTHAMPGSGVVVLEPRDATIEWKIKTCQTMLSSQEEVLVGRASSLDRTIGHDTRLLPVWKAEAQKELDDTLERYRHITLEPVHRSELARARNEVAKMDQKIAAHQAAQRQLDGIRKEISFLHIQKQDIAFQLDDFVYAWAQCAQHPGSEQSSCRKDTLKTLNAVFDRSQEVLDQVSARAKDLDVVVLGTWKDTCRNAKIH